MVKVYIASPYTKGNTGYNVHIAMDAAIKLIDLGFAPFSPIAYTHFLDIFAPRHYETWMRQDKVWVESCDCLLRLPGESSGADREINWALELGKPVFNSINDLVEYYKEPRILVTSQTVEDWNGYYTIHSDVITNTSSNGRTCTCGPTEDRSSEKTNRPLGL